MTGKGVALPSFLKQHGNLLMEAGYPIIPIRHGEKFPKGLLHWQKVKADEKHLNNWLVSKKFGKDGGVGVLTGRIIAVDIDVYEPELAAELIEWCMKNIGQAPVRVGQAPKALLVYRLADNVSELNKSLSAEYVDDDTNRNRIEILGNGQQFVAFATHPKTNEPYTWDRSLSEIVSDDLSPIFPHHIDDMFAEYHRLISTGEFGNLELRHGSTDSIYDGFTIDEVEPTEKEGSTPPNAHYPSNAETPHIGGKKREVDADALLRNAKVKANISQERLVKLLNHIDATDHDDWLRVGMGLYHQYKTGNARDLLIGYDLWNDWSKNAENYDAKVMKPRWRSFDAGLAVDPVTLASVIKMANDNVAHQVDSGDIDALALFLGRYIYIAEGDSICDLEKAGEYSVRKLNEFRNQTANQRHSVPSPSNKKKMKLEPVHSAWMVHPDRMTADTIAYRPDRKGERFFHDDKTGTSHINNFTLPEWAESHDESLLPIVIDHFDFLFPDETERTWFLDWMAHIIQRPEQRCLVHPLLIATEQGVGRGWVTKLITGMVGHWNMAQSQFSDLLGNHNGFVADVLVCSIGEVREGEGRYQVSDKVRDLLTEEYLLINRKYGSQGTMKIYTRFFMSSNHRDALVLPKEDRRVQVLTNPNYVKTKAYYVALNEWLNTQGVGQFYWWLMRRDISNFDFTRCSMTKGREAMLGTAMNTEDELFADWLNHCEFDVMTVGQVCRHILVFAGESDLGDKMMNEDHIRRKLTDKSTSWINKDGKDNRIRWRKRRYSPVVLKGDPEMTRDELTKKLDDVEEYLTNEMG